MVATIDEDNLEQTVYESPHSIDNFLSKEILHLSPRERNAIDEEIHGASFVAPNESPEFLEAALLELSEELDKIPDDCPSKIAYLESQALFPESYTNQPDFLLRFLRCELFDAQKAAIRMLKFLGFASELFGPKVLERPIRITDFTREEESNMRVGNVQILPFRDRSGRPIYARVGDFELEHGNVEIEYKKALYYHYAMSDDVESQRKGVTKLMWVGANNHGGVFPKLKWEYFEYNKKLYEASPVRTCATHWCLPDKPYFHVLRTGHAMSSGTSRSRMKFHIGDEVELLYGLKSYGIPVELIPVTGTGNIKKVYWKQWIRARRYLENERAKGNHDESVIECPRSTDVLFRSGTTLTSHPGNCMLQNIIEAMMPEHSSASNLKRTAIIKSIIQTIQQHEGRFLRWDNRGWWTQLECSSQIHTKVAVSMKGFRGKPVARRQMSHSSTFLFQNQDNRKRRRISRDDGCNSDSSSTESCCFF